ncbi:MAG: hypothetical protein LBC29_00500, partial [Propionibacteriaceae bacterium]|nr:hypothetical protein [Propionibacteriaceae bacterium]
AEFAQAYEYAPTEFVRDVVRDGVVSAAEMAESQSRVLECIAQSGLGITAYYLDNGFGLAELTFAAAENRIDAIDKQQEIVADCEFKWMTYIGIIYYGMMTNPNHENWDDLVAACLVRKGLVPEGFNGRDYVDMVETHRDLYDAISECAVDGCVEVRPAVEGAPPLTLPGGAPLYDNAEAQACTVVPLR